MKKMSRKNFLKSSITLGSFLTIPALMESCKSLPEKFVEISPWTNPEIPILWKCLYAGATAPNPHNTQAWKFKLLSDTEFLLFVDENRLLLDTDPPTRQIHIGQGSFIECFRIGASQFGYDTKIIYFPQGEYPISETGKKPVAKISLISGDTSRKKLFNSLIQRTTNRSVYSGESINEKEIQLINSQLSNSGIEVKWILANHPSFSRIKSLLVDAFSLETNLKRTNEENRIWFRVNDTEIYSQKDGISLRGNGMEGFSYHLISKFFVSTKPEDWHSDFTKNAGIDSFKKQVESSKGFVYIQTSQNKSKDWVLAGEKYAELNIVLNANSFALHPMSQFLQEYPEMNPIRLELESILEIPSKAKVQMFGRVGRSNFYFQSPRREIKSFFI